MYRVRYALVMRVLAVFAVFATLGCGGSKGGAGSTTGGTTNAPDAAAATTSAPAIDAGTEPPAPLSEQECAGMADHMIDIQLEDRRSKGAELPEPGQIDEIRRGIKKDFVPQCLEHFERAVYDCWMGANSHPEFEVCAGVPPPPEN